MSRSGRFVALAVLAASLALSASRAVAASPREELQARPAQSAAAHWNLWEWLRAVLAPVWSKEGCSIDPSGQCRGAAVHRAPVSPAGDSGCSIDPHGGGCAGNR